MAPCGMTTQDTICIDNDIFRVYEMLVRSVIPNYSCQLGLYFQR